jgi:hypothetical protein
MEDAMSTNWNPRRLGSVIFGLLAMAVIAAPAALAAAAAPATAGSEQERAVAQTRALWQQVSKASGIRAAGIREAAIRPDRGEALTLNHSGMRLLLAGAPAERSLAAKEHPLFLSLPAPNGEFQRFTLADSPVMEAGLAARHPTSRHAAAASTIPRPRSGPT